MKNLNTNCKILPTIYEDINSVNDVEFYAKEVKTNLPVQNGVIISPYYSLTVNGEEVTVYATRSANGVHSFIYLDVEVLDESKNFVLNMQVKTKEQSTVLKASSPTINVLPESSGVVATISGNTISATVNKTGNYSFVFNQTYLEPLTIFVAKKLDENTVFGGREVIYLSAGDYSLSETQNKTIFSEPNKVYYFKAGRYKIQTIEIPTNSVLYLEKGAYLEVMPDKTGERSPAIFAKGGKKVTVCGRGLLDFSACCGGEVPEGFVNDKCGLVLNQINDVCVSGVTVINSQTWTLCLNDCNHVRVNNCLFFGYRVFSDGVMLSDCKNAIVEDNFVRTGDDAFETKSTTQNGLTENVLFRNNSAWTDKAVAYGCIYESNHDTRGVRFENCSVGFANGTWSKHLGCCVIQMGNRKGAVMEDITFENIEVFATYNKGAINVYIGGSGGFGAGSGIVKNIHFNNITVKHNYDLVLNLQTYDAENCFIYDLYLNNVVSNGELFTKEKLNDKYYRNAVVGGYSEGKYLHINEE